MIRSYFSRSELNAWKPESSLNQPFRHESVKRFQVPDLFGSRRQQMCVCIQRKASLEKLAGFQTSCKQKISKSARARVINVTVNAEKPLFVHKKQLYFEAIYRPDVIFSREAIYLKQGLYSVSVIPRYFKKIQKLVIRFYRMARVEDFGVVQQFLFQTVLLINNFFGNPTKLFKSGSRNYCVLNIMH